jgi:putative N6-adenine-specific DNA methylase
VAVHCTTKKTRLYHTEKLTELVQAAVVAQVQLTDEGEKAAIYLRLKGDKAMVSFDATGAHLHKRGYRTEAGSAPLRENLAAGLLLRAGYDGSEPLLDPCCGSGTFPVEAAMIARKIAPGLGRSFAFEAQPEFDPKAWDRLKAKALENELDSAPQPIFGADRDPEAVSLAARTAQAAGVGEEVQVAVCDLSELTPEELGLETGAGGLLVANPPYGHRLTGASHVYGTLDGLLKGPFRHWRWGLVVAEGPGGRAFRCEPEARHKLVSGGLSLEFATGGETNSEG